jgi:hypothetical protein
MQHPKSIHQPSIVLQQLQTVMKPSLPRSALPAANIKLPILHAVKVPTHQHHPIVTPEQRRHPLGRAVEECHPVRPP